MTIVFLTQREKAALKIALRWFEVLSRYTNTRILFGQMFVSYFSSLITRIRERQHAISNIPVTYGMGYSFHEVIPRSYILVHREPGGTLTHLNMDSRRLSSLLFPSNSQRLIAAFNNDNDFDSNINQVILRADLFHCTHLYLTFAQFPELREVRDVMHWPILPDSSYLKYMYLACVKLSFSFMSWAQTRYVQPNLLTISNRDDSREFINILKVAGSFSSYLPTTLHSFDNLSYDHFSPSVDASATQQGLPMYFLKWEAQTQNNALYSDLLDPCLAMVDGFSQQILDHIVRERLEFWPSV